MQKTKCRSISLAVSSLLVASGSAWGAVPDATHTVGGTVGGLIGKGLVLRLSGQETSAIEVSPGPDAVRFAFPTGLPPGSTYALTVQAQPHGPSQLCAVTHGQAGRIGTSDVSDVMVDCSGTAGMERPNPPVTPNQNPPAPPPVQTPPAPPAHNPPAAPVAGQPRATDPKPLAKLPPQSEPHSWDLYVDAFQAQVNITGLSYDNGDCNMSGGTVRSIFRQSPASQGEKIGRISWEPTSAGSVSLEFYIDSDATVGEQHGQVSANIPLECEASDDHFTHNTYRMTGAFSSLDGVASLTSSMPQDADTTGVIGCPPKTNTCHVQYWFDNSPGPSRTTMNLSQLLSTGSVVVPIRGIATNVANYGEKRSGNYSWSGSVKLRAEPSKD